jgi:sulfur carrier protein
MQIQCNDQHVQIQAATLDQALTELGYKDARVATALNGEFVPKSERGAMRLKAGDRLEILSAMQGG